LFGEHAVVYGYPAIAVPVTQVQAKAIVVPNPIGSSGEIRISAPAISIDGMLKSLPADHPIAKAIHLTLKSVDIPVPPAFNLKVSSTIPIAAGLGSGAAITVVLIRAVSNFLGKPLSDEVISELTFEVEKIYHGTPSGIDNTVVTYGMPVYFVMESPLETFTVKKPFSIVIGDTGISSPTAVAVGNVRKAWEAQPEKFNQIFESCGEVASQARRAIETGDVKVLGPLMDENQALLVEMGVSSPELEKLIVAAKEAGALGAKLSGAGGGGNMIALALAEKTDSIAEALERAGATRTIVTQVGKS
jgi:mevalonate kinase